jgi:hypothetical protein
MLFIRDVHRKKHIQIHFERPVPTKEMEIRGVTYHIIFFLSLSGQYEKVGLFICKRMFGFLSIYHEEFSSYVSESYRFNAEGTKYIRNVERLLKKFCEKEDNVRTYATWNG